MACATSSTAETPAVPSRTVMAMPTMAFLIPMAISIAFGIIFATFIILLLVPALYLAIEDGIGLGSWLGREKRSDASTPPIDAVETLGADR